MRIETQAADAGAQPLGAAWGIAAETDAAPRPATEADRLDYLGDMLDELRLMAEQAGCRRLAALLALAEDEARRQADDGR
jgi:hypothetical protein